MITATIRGLTRLQKDLKAESKAQVRALQTAIKVEGFRLRKKLKSDISKGKPGGREFAPISAIAARTGARRIWGAANRRRFGGIGTLGAAKKKALRRLGSVVRYQVEKEPFVFRFGWVGRLSKNWQALVEMHQKGFTTPVDEELRKTLRRQGAKLPKDDDDRFFFFLKRTTTQLRTPARPILEPFWKANEKQAWENIRKNFRRKLAGQRI